MGLTTLNNQDEPVTQPRQPTRWLSALVLLRPVFLALAVFTVGMAVAVTFDYDPRGRLVPVGLQVALALGGALVAVLWNLGSRIKEWAADLTAAAASAFPAVVLAVALHGSQYAVGGLGVSQANRTTAVARYIQSWQLADYSYQGLPAFYPPLMPWLTGRFAALFDVTPYYALKLASIAMLFAAPLLAYLLWRRVLPTPVAAFMPVAIVALVGVAPSAIRQPDSFLAMVVLVPWWLDAVLGLRRPDVRRWPFWVHGIIGALLFCFYYYYFFPLALSLPLLPLLWRWHGRSSFARYRWITLVLLTAAALSAVYWLRFLISWIQADDPVSLQNRWFSAPQIELHVDMFDWTPTAMIMLAGLGYLVFTARRDRFSAGLLLLLVAGYTWYVLGYVLALVHKPVVAFRTEPLLALLMLAGGVRAVAALVSWAAEHTSTLSRIRPGDTSRVVTALGLALVFVLGQNVIVETLGAKYVRQAHNTPLPNGELQPHAADDIEPPDVSINKLESVVREMNNFSATQPVILSTNHALPKVSGMYVFNQWHAIYAHPAGEFRARLDFLHRLADTQAPRRFAEMARGNRFDPIDVMVLKVRDDMLTYTALGVDFPNSDRRIRVEFQRQQFAESYWQTRRVGPYLIAAARRTSV